MFLSLYVVSLYYIDIFSLQINETCHRLDDLRGNEYLDGNKEISIVMSHVTKSILQIHKFMMFVVT